MADTKYLLCIVGPTAVGKTELTIELARFFDSDIISADSRQFFKEMSIGTAKPTPEEQLQAKHHFVDSHNLSEGFSAGRYEKECLTLLQELFKERNLILLTGGSGLYIQAVLEGLPDMPKIPDEIRTNLNDELTEKGLAFLQEELKIVDPIYYKEVDLLNPQRVIRALEIYRATQTPFSQLRKKSAKKRFFKSIIIGLERPREELYQRINSRVDQMLQMGLLEEVKSLEQYKNLPALQTVGYSELFDFLDDKISLDDAINLIKRNTRRYAKRQMTWFRKDQKIKWFHPDDFEVIKEYVSSKMLE